MVTDFQSLSMIVYFDSPHSPVIIVYLLISPSFSAVYIKTRQLFQEIPIHIFCESLFFSLYLILYRWLCVFSIKVNILNVLRYTEIYYKQSIFFPVDNPLKMILIPFDLRGQIPLEFHVQGNRFAFAFLFIFLSFFSFTRVEN